MCLAGSHQLLCHLHIADTQLALSRLAPPATRTDQCTLRHQQPAAGAAPGGAMQVSPFHPRPCSHPPTDAPPRPSANRAPLLRGWTAPDSHWPACQGMVTVSATAHMFAREGRLTLSAQPKDSSATATCPCWCESCGILLQHARCAELAPTPCSAILCNATRPTARSTRACCLG